MLGTDELLKKIGVPNRGMRGKARCLRKGELVRGRKITDFAQENWMMKNDANALAAESATLVHRTVVVDT